MGCYNQAEFDYFERLLAPSGKVVLSATKNMLDIQENSDQPSGWVIYRYVFKEILETDSCHVRSHAST